MRCVRGLNQLLCWGKVGANRNIDVWCHSVLAVAGEDARKNVPDVLFVRDYATPTNGIAETAYSKLPDSTLELEGTTARTSAPALSDNKSLNISQTTGLATYLRLDQS